MIRVLKIAFLVFVLLCGVLFLTVGVQNYPEKKAAGEGGLYLFVIFLIGVLPFVGGLYGLYKQSKRSGGKSNEPKEELPEVKVLKLATKQDGKVTIPEVAILLAMKHKEAEELLERMRMDGAFELEMVAETGAIIYNLANHASQSEKDGARGLLD
ncbi:MAG: hypothetical protein HRT61_12795 [Ekhidna sp.]|nr:hypothetical protein [Ekhidna sp.]